MQRSTGFFASLSCSLLLLSTLGGGSPAARALEPEQAMAFLQEKLTQGVEEQGVVGAAGVIMADGEIIASYGAGLADKAAGIAMDPATSRFRLASISKTITAAAVLQLVDEDKLDLDADISQYLDFEPRIPLQGKVTLRHLLTHTAGFSDVYRQIFALDAADNPSLGEYVRTLWPEQIFETGAISAYSNFSFSLAGYIVEVVSGMPYDQYVEENIFRPLGMASASMAQPPSDLPDYSWPTGYRNNGEPVRFEYVGGGPAGSLTATLEDYALFMGMVLGKGEYRGVRILSSASVAQMLTLQGIDQGSRVTGSGFGLAWYVSAPTGEVRNVVHGGDTVLFHSLASVYPGKGLALVYSQNTEGPVLTGSLGGGFEELVGLPAVPGRPEQVDQREDQRVAGDYYGARYSGHGVLSLSKLLRAARTVSDVPEGGIGVGSNSTYKRVGPLTYQNREKPDDLLVFFESDSGVIEQASNGMRRFPWYERPAVVAALAVFGAGGLLLGLWQGLVAILRSRRGETVSTPARTAGLMSLLLFAGVGVFAQQVMIIQADIFAMIAARDLPLRLAQGLMAGGLLLVPVLAFSLLSQQLSRQPSQQPQGQLSAGVAALYSIIVVAAVVSGYLIVHWNLISPGLVY